MSMDGLLSELVIGALKTTRKWLTLHWSRITFVARVAAVSWVGIVGVTSGLQFLEVIPEFPKLDPTAWGVSLTLLGADNVGALISRRLRQNRAKRDGQIEKALMALLIGLVQSDGGLRFEMLGANVFQLNRDGSLARVARFRPAGPQRSGIEWTTGKGVVGECARKRKAIYKEWHPIAKRYASGDVDESRFEKMNTETKNGFDRGEFNAIASKYSEILAEPIWHTDAGEETTLVGVLTVDRAYDPNDDGFTARLRAPFASQSAVASASVVASVLHPPKAAGE